MQCKGGVTDDELDLWDAMRGKSTGVLQHRWVMAKHIGRPLRRDEHVDHMDGNRANNAIENLRIYLAGKNHPGSCPGYGTYYDEWQKALARIAELEAEVARLMS